MRGADGGVDAMAPMCMTSSDCAKPGNMPICTNGTCGACQAGEAGDVACAAISASTPRCMPMGDMAANGGECVACLPTVPPMSSSDCSKPNLSVCDTSGTCRACTKHSECGSGICILDGTAAGTCATPSQVSLVDNGGLSVASCQSTRTGRDGMTSPTAYCDISEAVAVAVASGRPFALVKGSAQPYGIVTLTDQNFTIVGPGKSTSTTAVARLYGSNATSVTFNATSGAHTVVLDGLELGGDVGGKSLHGVACNNATSSAASGTLVVRNSGLHDSSGEAITNSGCTLVADANIIGTWGSAGGNLGGGIVLTGNNVSTITNNIIAGNGSVTTGTTAGITIGNGSTVNIAFNTIVYNTIMGGGAAGVDCGSLAPKTIANTIFYKNGTTGGTQIIGSMCTLVDVATFAGDDTKGSMTPGAPGFVSLTDFHLVPKNTVNEACCVDKVSQAMAAAIPNSGHDVDQTTRPVGKAYDIGAHEVE